ncbi:MAG: hypothetical protein AB1568_00430 [Thermodesulfobacteriota bacterium]
MNNIRAMRWLAQGAILLVGIQLLLIVLQGEPACFNEGCRVVEGLTRIPPLWFNLLGLAYFAVLLAALALPVAAPSPPGPLVALLLLAGMAAEGVLFSYQFLVARTFCGYCLVIFAVVLSLNLLAGVRQAGLSLAVFTGILAIFPTLHFGPGLLGARGLTLDNGSSASLKPIPSVQEGYLFFSESCEHCQNVLRNLPADNRCTLHFNPISNAPLPPLPGVTPIPGSLPEVNRAMLSLLGIREIPVLLVRGADTLRIVKGEKSIRAFFREECSAAAVPATPLSIEPYMSSPDGEGECSAETETCTSP